ncbi:virulence associated lipoprotein [Borreliella lanei]|uniref:Chemotaxis protein histidine kinase CheA n=1 Tax=Borreliella lanei TaxID=373540 RepID=A0A7W9ZBR3_9SPIR|nr:virulence associated lipoprotein [Borreliella lanei]MBB6208450.1 chemotaxis protein histidine kinase CheA [Borreliella lanei]
MKYHIIVTIFVFLFLACRPDFNTDQKDIKYPPTEKSRPKTEDSKQKESKPKTEEELKKQEEEELKKQEEEELKKQEEEEELKKQEEEELKKQEEEEELKKQEEEEELKKQEEEELKKQEEEELKKQEEEEELKNTLLNDLREQIKEAYYFKEKYVKNMENEPKDQYGVQAFNKLNWGKGTEDISDNTERSIRFRRHTYTLLSTLDIDELKEFSDIMQKGKASKIFNSFSTLGGVLDIVSDHLYTKKDNLDKLNISDLEQLKNSFKKILSIIKSVSEMSKQIILDYENNKDLIQTDVNELKSYLNKLYNEFQEKAKEAERLEKFIVSTYNP